MGPPLRLSDERRRPVEEEPPPLPDHRPPLGRLFSLLFPHLAVRYPIISSVLVNRISVQRHLVQGDEVSLAVVVGTGNQPSELELRV